VLEAIISWTVAMVTFDSKQVSCHSSARNATSTEVCQTQWIWSSEGKLSIAETRNSSISACFSLFLTLNFSLFFLFCSLSMLLVSCLFYNLFGILFVIFTFILYIFLYVPYRQDWHIARQIRDTLHSIIIT